MKTQCERLLEVLSDGEPHDHLSLYRLGMIVHSRVADLRRQGHMIVCWQANENGQRLSVYQLLPPVALDTGEGAGGGCSSSSVSSAAPDPIPSGAASTFEQLVIA